MELRDENFHELIQEGKVLVDFFATWCGPCKMQAPILKKFSEEMEDVKVLQVDVDQHEELAEEYGILSIPTLILFENGEEKHKNIGLSTLEDLRSWF